MYDSVRHTTSSSGPAETRIITIFFCFRFLSSRSHASTTRPRRRRRRRLLLATPTVAAAGRAAAPQEPVPPYSTSLRRGSSAVTPTRRRERDELVFRVGTIVVARRGDRSGVPADNARVPTPVRLAKVVDRERTTIRGTRGRGAAEQSGGGTDSASPSVVFARGTGCPRACSGAFIEPRPPIHHHDPFAYSFSTFVLVFIFIEIFLHAVFFFFFYFRLLAVCYSKVFKNAKVVVITVREIRRQTRRARLQHTGEWLFRHEIRRNRKIIFSTLVRLTFL